MKRVKRAVLWVASLSVLINTLVHLSPPASPWRLWLLSDLGWLCGSGMAYVALRSACSEIRTTTVQSYIAVYDQILMRHLRHYAVVLCGAIVVVGLVLLALNWAGSFVAITWPGYMLVVMTTALGYVLSFCVAAQMIHEIIRDIGTMSPQRRSEL